MSLFGVNAQSTSGFGGFNKDKDPNKGMVVFGVSTSTSRNNTFTTTGDTTNINQPSTNLFGSTNTGQVPSNQFGSTNAGQAPFNVFGSTNTANQSAAPSLFGGANTAAQPASSNLLGNASTSAQPASNLFGQPASASTNLFGSANTASQPASTNLFGGLNNSTAAQPASTNLFGSTNTATQPASTSLFGSSNTTAQPSSNLFGSTTTAAQPALTNLFGNTSATTQPATSNLFGSTTAAQPASSSLFGSTITATQPATQTGGGSLFGNRPQGSLFGSTVATGSGLNTSAFGSRPALTQAQLQADAQSQMIQLQQKIEAVYNAWNPSSPQCRFQYYFYNLVNPNQISQYGRPPSAKNDALWEKANRENPDPTSHVPVLALGFDDLRARVEAQNKKSEQYAQTLKDLKTRLDSLSTQHSLSNTPRLSRAILSQTQLTQKFLKFAQHLHLLIPSVRSSSIRPEEERLRAILEEIEDDLRRGRMKGKLNELWALLGAVNAAKERAKSGTGEWAVVDEDGLAQLTQILSDQQAGLAHLTKILQKARKDVGIINGSGSNVNSTSTSSSANPYLKRSGIQSDYDVDNLFSSTNTLRASAQR